MEYLFSSTPAQTPELSGMRSRRDAGVMRHVGSSAGVVVDAKSGLCAASCEVNTPEVPEESWRTITVIDTF